LRASILPQRFLAAHDRLAGDVPAALREALILPHLAVARELRRKTFIAIEVVDAEPLSRSLDVIHPRQRPLSQEATALLSTLRAAVSEAGAPRRRRSRRQAGTRRRA
jgi:hypothetical protein